MTIFRLRHFLSSLVVLCASFGASRWLQKVWSCPMEQPEQTFREQEGKGEQKSVFLWMAGFWMQQVISESSSIGWS